MPQGEKSLPLRALWWSVLLTVLLLLVILPFLLFEQQVSSLTEQLLRERPFWTLAPAIAAALALDVVLPIPSSIVNTSAGALLGFVPATLVCWTGMTAGCLLGYWIGATGGAASVRRLIGAAELERSIRIGRAIGVGTVVLARAVPVLAEATTIAAGAASLPPGRYLFAVALANLGIAGVYAAVGALALEVQSFMLVVAGAVTLPVIGWAGHQIWLRLRRASG